MVEIDRFLFIITFYMNVKLLVCDENDNSMYPQQVMLSEWDSGFYGKSTCSDIPSNLSICSDIGYKQMRLPNYLGHESIAEVNNFILMRILK